MIKIIFPKRKTVKKVGTILNKLLSEKYSSETIHNTIWFKGLYLKISSHTIIIDIFSNNFILEDEVKEILKHSLKNEHSYILCYNELQFYIDNLNTNYKILQTL